MIYKFKKGFIVFLIIISQIISLNAYSYNSSWTNLYVDINGWCSGLEIPFRVYNETQYENRKEIESDLCTEDENPDEDNCKEFDEIEAKVTIYKGPMASFPELYSRELNSDDEFSFTFEEEGSYLIEIIPTEGEYNDYHDILEIIDCNFNSDNDNDDEEEVIELFNSSFNFDGVIINLINTTITNESELKVFSITDFKLAKLPDLNNSKKTISISSKNNNFTELDIEIPINFDSNFNYTVFKLDKDLNEWEEVNGIEINQKENRIILKRVNYGIYSIVENLKESPNSELNKSININNSNTNLNENEIKSHNSNLNSNEFINYENSNSKKNIYILGFIVIIIIIGIIIFLMMNRSSKGNNENNVYLNNNESNTEVLDSYSQTYKKTKEYVQKYKNDYSKDQIYRGLKSVNIPEDIIDKVFMEEF